MTCKPKYTKKQVDYLIADTHQRIADISLTPGADGNTPYIQAGTWWIDGVDTGFVAIGQDGAQGIQGVPGNDGADGVDGAQGIQGVPGADGATGPQGIQGLPGNDGADGAQGIQGVPGNDGADGADGAQGIQGVPGADGADGAQGIQGVPGNDGATGATGPQGEQGNSHLDGELFVPAPGRIANTATPNYVSTRLYIEHGAAFEGVAIWATSPSSYSGLSVRSDAGDFFIANTGGAFATAYNVLSDEGEKSDISKIPNTGTLSKLARLNVYEYVLKKSKLQKIGVMAGDMGKIFPSTVSQPEKKSPEYVDYSQVVCILIGAINELSSRVEELEKGNNPPQTAKTIK